MLKRVCLVGMCMFDKFKPINARHARIMVPILHLLRGNRTRRKAGLPHSSSQEFSEGGEFIFSSCYVLSASVSLIGQLFSLSFIISHCELMEFAEDCSRHGAFVRNFGNDGAVLQGQDALGLKLIEWKTSLFIHRANLDEICIDHPTFKQRRGASSQKPRLYLTSDSGQVACYE